MCAAGLAQSSAWIAVFFSLELWEQESKELQQNQRKKIEGKDGEEITRKQDFCKQLSFTCCSQGTGLKPMINTWLASRRRFRPVVKDLARSMSHSCEDVISGSCMYVILPGNTLQTLSRLHDAPRGGVEFGM